MVIRWHYVEIETLEPKICLVASRKKTISCSLYTPIGLTCHFKHPGLNEGLLFFAASAVVKTYKACVNFELADRRGSWFASYVTRGNLLKTRLTGSGVLSQREDTCCDCLASALIRGGLTAFASAGSASCGIIAAHVERGR